MENRIKTIWLLVCILGMVVQNVFVTIEYFRYAATTEVNLEIEEEFSPPDFSICFYLRELLDPCENSIQDDCLDQSFVKYPLRDIMTKYTLNVTSTLEKVAYYDQEMDDFKHYNGSDMSDFLDEFYDDDQKCLRVSHKENRSIQSSRLSRLSKDAFRYLMIYGKNESRNSFKGKVMGNLFHAEDTFPRGFHIEMYTSVFHNYSSLKEFTYRKNQFSYLPPPYSSGCRKYEGSLESREHCIERCIKGKVTKRGQNMAIKELTYTPNEWSDDLRIQVGFNQEKLFSFYDSCYRRCPIGCQTLYYEPELIFKSDHENFGFMFAVALKKLTRQLTFSAKFDGLSYVIYIASVCSLWLGFVIFDSFILTIPLIVKHCEKWHHKSHPVVVNQIHQNTINLNLTIRPNKPANRMASIEI